jgi:hypothetical protein
MTVAWEGGGQPSSSPFSLLDRGDPDHCQDAGLEGLGQPRPCIHDDGQVGVGPGGKLGGSLGTFLIAISRFKTR